MENRDIPFPLFTADNPLEAFFGRAGEHDLAELRKTPISPKEEREYGERVFAGMSQEWKRRRVDVVARGADAEYVRKLVELLRPAMTNNSRYDSLRVLVVQTDETDAYSIPGGTIVVYRGMIDFAGSEAALAGVIGHELSHLDRGHQLLPLQRAKYLQSNTRHPNPVQMDQFLRNASVFMSAFMRPFHPEDETEADRDGATWAYRAGYDPRELSALFARMNERTQVAGLMPAFLRTHPFHADRQAQVDRRYRELQAEDPRADLYIGRVNLRRRTPMSVQKFPE